jgi:uncharacterized protein (TIGR02453 family)
MMLHASTLDFLSGLTLHNQRDWFQSHKSLFDEIRVSLNAFVAAWIERVAVMDPSVRREAPQTTLFRIYRDLRFSPDKTPYKTHFGIYLAQGGKCSPMAGYYLHIDGLLHRTRFHSCDCCE